MARIQSSNIGDLCAQLGFPPDGELHGRDPKKFKREAADFRVRFAQQGHPLPFHEPYSIEAEKYALAFCQEEDRGEKFWPPNHHDWPSWTEDRRKILLSLTHIFGLQAYYKYQKEGKAKRKTGTSVTPPIPETEEMFRELSPHSRLYVGPSPPRGTKRRPVKVTTEGTDNIVEMSMGNNGSGPDVDGAVEREIHEACKEEIAALDPRRDDKPIKEFTLQWLTKTGSRWPVQADPRLKIHMHQHNHYDNENEDYKLIEVIKNLRKGTEIETCDPEHYNLLKRRLLERVGVLTRDLLAKGLLQQQVGQKPEKTLCFEDYWQHRHASWGPRPTKSSAKKTPLPPRASNIYDFEMSDEDFGGSPSLPHRSTQRLTSKTNEAVRSPTSRKSDEMHGAALEGNRYKRQKISTNAIFVERPSSAVSPTIRVAPTNGVDHSNISSSHTEPDENNTYIEEALSYLEEQTGDIPLEPSGGQGPPSAENPKVSERRDSLKATVEDQHLKVTSTEQASSSEDATSSSSDDRQRLVLVLQKSARDLDLDFNNTLPSTRLRNTNVSQFFQLYSERALVPLDALDCLTFTLTFVGGNEEVVRQGDEAAWKRLINTTRVLFMLQSKRCPSTKEFQIVVEIGDKTTGVVPVPYDDVW